MKYAPIILCLCFFVVGFSLSKLLTGQFDINFDTVSLQRYDSINHVGCGSDSMGLTFNCNDLLYSSQVMEKDKLEIGNIYIYQKDGSNHTVVHRLIECLDKDCNTTIFKGDNNRIGEKVKREDILYKVVKVEYT